MIYSLQYKNEGSQETYQDIDGSQRDVSPQCLCHVELSPTWKSPQCGPLIYFMGLMTFLQRYG